MSARAGRTPPDGVFERVCKAIVRTLEASGADLSLTPDTYLFGQGLGVDSIEVLRLAAALEEEFDLTLGDEELTLEAFEQVGRMVALVQRKLEGAG